MFYRAYCIDLICILPLWRTNVLINRTQAAERAENAVFVPGNLDL